VALSRPAWDSARNGGPWCGAGGGGIRKENIKEHVKYGSVGFKGSF
jgi:hypothetical protein